MTRTCAVCGSPCRIDHHLTGQALDGDLVAPVCHDHHQFAHDDWHTRRVGAAEPPANFLDRLHLRLSRTALFLGRLALAEVGGPLIRLLAGALAGWAAKLQEVVMMLDTYYPSWRTAPGMDEEH